MFALRFRFVPAADETVDPEWAVETARGSSTPLAIQVSLSPDGDGACFTVNEYLYENGDLSAVQMHGTYRCLAAAKARAEKIYRQRIG